MFKLKKVSWLVLSTLLLFPAASCFASDPATIDLTAEGSVQMPVNRVTINFSVDTTAATAQSAVQDNAKKTTALIDALRKILPDKNDISTTSYTLNPQYEYDKNTQKNKLAGYQAINKILVATSKIDALGSLIDTAVNQGVNHIDGINFSNSEKTQYQEKALQKAIQSGLEKAKLMAQAADVTINKILLLSPNEAQSPNYPMMKTLAFSAMNAQTPTEINDLEITSSVHMIFSLQPD